MILNPLAAFRDVEEEESKTERKKEKKKETKGK
jgi:hypothetical protein